MDAEKKLALIDRLCEVFDISPDGALIVKAPLRVSNNEGNIVCEIGGDLDGGFLQVKSNQGRIMASFGCTPNGGFVDLRHPDPSRLAISMSVNTEGVPSVEGYDTSGEEVKLFPLDTH